MIQIRSHSIDELEALTGINQRTIAYYIQQGLLPKVGRRGRNTRYPHLFVDRLKFIQQVRDLQDSGRLGSVSLPRIARVLWHLVEQAGGSQELPELGDGDIQRLFDEEVIPDERVLGKTEDGEPITLAFGKFGPYVRAGKQTASIDAEDFNSITADDALEQIATKAAEKERQLINEFEEAGIQVRDGRFGPYVCRDGINAKIPKSMDPTRLTLEDCENLLQKRRDKLARKSASKRREKLIIREPDTAYVAESAGTYEPPIVAYSLRDAGDLRLEPSHSFLAEEAGDELSEIQAQVLHIETRAQRPNRDRGRISETWTRAPISEHIEIAVRGIDPEHSDLVESLAKKLRKLLGSE